MKPPPFSYFRPTTVTAAVERLAADDGAIPLSGGQSLIPMLNMRLARPTTVVDLGSVGLDVIEDRAEGIHLGGRVTHAQLEHHPWPAGFDAMADGVKQIGYDAIRHRGTVGGSLAHADPAAELPCLMVAFDATVELTSSQGTRAVPADDLFVGYYETLRRQDEIITSVTVPVREGLRSGFAELSRRPGDFALALAAVSTWPTGSGKEARAVVGGLDVRPRRIPEVEEALATGGDPFVAVTAEMLARRVEPSSDIHASAGYRLEVGTEMLRRAIVSVERS